MDRIPGGPRASLIAEAVVGVEHKSSIPLPFHYNDSAILAQVSCVFVFSFYLCVTFLQIYLPNFMECGSVLQRAEVLAIDPYSNMNPAHAVPFCFFLRSVLIFTSHLYQGLRSILFPSSFRTKTWYAFLFCPVKATCLLPYLITTFGGMWAGMAQTYSDSLRAGRSRDRMGRAV
jgi:hypothetical protein